MVLLIAAALASGLTTAALLASISPLAALIIAPLMASAAAILASLLIAWRNTRDKRGSPALDVQTDAMVAALRDVAQQAKPASPAPSAAATNASPVFGAPGASSTDVTTWLDEAGFEDVTLELSGAIGYFRGRKV